MLLNVMEEGARLDEKAAYRSLIERTFSPETLDGYEIAREE